MPKLSYLFSAMLLFFVSACSSDSEEDLLGVEECSETNISFSQKVLPIMNESCAFPGCHAANIPAAGINLSSFESITAYFTTDQDRFLGAIRHESGYSPMPKSNDKLSDCNLYYIETWIAEGASNN